MKTLKGWRNSNKKLSDYINEPCKIDEDLFNYFGEVVVPQFWSQNFIQLGEAQYSDKYGITYYGTCSKNEFDYFYLGTLPEFKK